MPRSVAHPQVAPREGRSHGTRGRVWWHRRALDVKLAQGVPPSCSPELTYRAEQLVSRRCRRSFAGGIKRIMDAAGEPPSPFTAAVSVNRAEILESSAELADLADILRSDEDVEVRGLALLEPFLTSGDSPLFHPQPEESLDRTVRRIRTALLLR